MAKMSDRRLALVLTVMKAERDAYFSPAITQGETEVEPGVYTSPAPVLSLTMPLPSARTVKHSRWSRFWSWFRRE